MVYLAMWDVYFPPCYLTEQYGWLVTVRGSDALQKVGTCKCWMCGLVVNMVGRRIYDAI